MFSTSFEPSTRAIFSKASRKAPASSPAVMRPFRSRRMTPSRSLLPISRCIRPAFSFSLCFQGLRTQARQRFGVYGRELQVKRLQRLNQNLRHSVIPEPFMIGRDDVPGRGLCGAFRNGMFVRSLIIVPIRAFLKIGWGGFPVLVGIPQPLLEPPRLFLA